MEKEDKTERERMNSAKQTYRSPKIEKHENLKEITLLSFTPPTE